MSSDPHVRSLLYGRVQTALLVLFGAACLWGGAPWAFVPGPVTLLVGGVLCGAGVALVLIGVVTLRRVIQIAPEPRPDGALVTSGVYRWFRHPIYTGIVLVVGGLVLRRPTVIAVGAGLVVIVFLVIKVRFEERLLAERYPEYADYRRRAWGVLPGL